MAASLALLEIDRGATLRNEPERSLFRQNPELARRARTVVGRALGKKLPVLKHAIGRRSDEVVRAAYRELLKLAPL